MWMKYISNIFERAWYDKTVLKVEYHRAVKPINMDKPPKKEKKSEDEQLAKNVTGIDLIVSGHTHTTLHEPIVVGDTYIVSAGPYSENLGSITLSWNEAGEKTLVDYELIPVDETVPEDQAIRNLTETWKTQVSAGYLSRYGLTYDQILTTSDFALNTPQSGVQSGNSLGELVSDSFLWAVEHR